MKEEDEKSAWQVRLKIIGTKSAQKWLREEEMEVGEASDRKKGK